MIKILAGEHEYDNGWVTNEATVSYKPQHIDVDMDCTVQMWLDSELGMRWRSGEFNVNVIRALGVIRCSQSVLRNCPVESDKLFPSLFAWVVKPICTFLTNHQRTSMPMLVWRLRRPSVELWKPMKSLLS